METKSSNPTIESAYIIYSHHTHTRTKMDIYTLNQIKIYQQ